MKFRISSSILLFALTTSSFATSTYPAKFYIGIFGGVGRSNTFNVTQLGTINFVEAAGGALNVNAFGRINNQTSSFFGAHLGYKAADILLNPASPWTLGPAAELEGFTMSNTTFKANLQNNSDRLAELNMDVSYPTSKNVYLANAVVSFNNPCILFHPYIGLGIGAAILRITSADSIATNPPEPGINHYAGNSSDTYSTFAAQIKLGFSYDLNTYLSLFADYRWLYLASSHFVFGSTGFPAPHAPSSPWEVKFDTQNYNMLNIGLRVSL